MTMEATRKARSAKMMYFFLASLLLWLASMIYLLAFSTFSLVLKTSSWMMSRWWSRRDEREGATLLVDFGCDFVHHGVELDGFGLDVVDFVASFLDEQPVVVDLELLLLHDLVVGRFVDGGAFVLLGVTAHRHLDLVLHDLLVPLQLLRVEVLQLLGLLGQ